MYAIPYEDYEEYGIRKYGFHGTSHRYIAKHVGKYLNKPAEESKLLPVTSAMAPAIAAIQYGKVLIPQWV